MEGWGGGVVDFQNLTFLWMFMGEVKSWWKIIHKFFRKPDTLR